MILRDNPLLYQNQNNTEVVTMYLTVMTGNEGERTNHTWKEVNTYSVYDYEDMGVDRYRVEGLLQVGDENGVVAGELGYGQKSPNCTVQIRGQSSSQNSQKNYKIELKENKGQWRSQSTIALNKHQGEGLRFRNKLAFDLISGVEQLMGLRTTFVHLYVKDTTAGGNNVFTDYGLYTQVEQLNKRALEARNLDKNGQLYKVNFCEFYRYEDIIKLKEDPDYDVKAFEEILEIKGSDDHSKLIEMLEAVNDYTVPIEDTLDKYFDIENISYWMAFHLLIGNVDTQSRNFYIYSPLHGQKWYILNWDIDGSFVKEEYAIKNTKDYAEWERGISNYWGNILFQRCLKSEKYQKALDDAINDLRNYLSKTRLNDMAKKYASVVKPYVYRMPDLMYIHLTSSQYDRVVNTLADEVDSNYQSYKESYKKPMPFYIGTPFKQDGKMKVEWDNSYDFKSENITYTFELARDYNFTNIISKQENLRLPVAAFDNLPKGQYFIRVRATNESGQSQYAFDYYHVSDVGKAYGTKCFYVDAEGKITEDA